MTHPLTSDFLTCVREALHNQTLDKCSRWAVSRRVMKEALP
jgi:hypothetical protein